jgi:flagellar motor switch protein FliN
MAQLTAEQVRRTIEACRARLAEMGETFRANLDCDLRLSAADPRPYAADAVSPFDGPGLAVSLVLGEQGLLLLIPEPIPLPSWYCQPGISENNRLQTFAHELSLQLLPADLQADRYSATAVPSLKEFAERAEIPPAATALDLAVFYADAAASDPPLATILVIVPVEIRAVASQIAASPDGLPASDETRTAEGMEGETSEGELPSAEPSAVSPESSSDASIRDNAVDAASADASEQPAATKGTSLEQTLRALRILNVPVTVSVRLAERKMPLGQIVALAPGSLVPFNKSCEDLLDLFVNNCRYCQGEAIKIGENFGLKVAKVGVTEERKEHIF